MTRETEAEQGADRRAYYAAGMLDAARIVGTRAHLSEAQDATDAVSSVLRYCEAAIQQRAAMICPDEADTPQANAEGVTDRG